ncbi:helix-turn-helix transcriptional regulator [Cupriavidus plantarum]|uniref:helix-turn-helix transcriptional regulator n=1 Tax=Cupriavidus plantarum TaxID=942865 RepID=UPI001B2828AB|nr:AraC family transcriptional regulator [Cupriavidus plantarum]CAG2138841.1 Transcriptional activator NphR [Cupriavidus plantarum]SMR85806.1 transcriptional regulator, AraC family [Cupriavidus plantarum]
MVELNTSIQRWSTDDVEPHLRSAYWIDAIGHSLARCEIEIAQSEGFRATLMSGGLGPLAISRTQASADRTVRRSRHVIAADLRERFYLVTSTCGPWTVRTRTGSVNLLADDAVLLSSAREHVMHLPADTCGFFVELPASWAHRWLLSVDDHVGVPMDASRGWSRVLCAFVAQMLVDFPYASPVDGAMLADELGALVARALNPPGEMPVRRPPEPMQKILHCIRDRHREGGLAAADIATDLGMSIRTLHRHLATLGTSMSQCLMQTRIESARAMLASPALRTLSIAEIGHRCGFSDASHFIKQFRRITAITPGRFRREALPE